MIGKTGSWQSRDTTTITIAAPGAGRYNFLTSITVTGDAAANIIVQSPSGTTIWDSELFAGGGGFVKDWDEENGLRGAENSALIISVSAGNYKISVNGIIVG